jgi:hypothetical protein
LTAGATEGATDGPAAGMRASHSGRSVETMNSRAKPIVVACAKISQRRRSIPRFRVVVGPGRSGGRLPDWRSISSIACGHDLAPPQRFFNSSRISRSSATSSGVAAGAASCWDFNRFTAFTIQKMTKARMMKFSRMVMKLPQPSTTPLF